MKTAKMILNTVLACVFAFTLIPMISGATQEAEATVGLQAGTSVITPNSDISDGTVIAFAGEEWWVIGDATRGVYPQANSVTLFLKSSGNPYGDTRFNDDSVPTGDEYKGSALQNAITTIATNIQSFSPKEYALINPRTLSAADDTNFPISGGEVANQRLWPISYDEWDTINNDTVRSFGNPTHFWLRSPIYTNNVWLGYGTGQGRNHNLVSFNFAVRPAFSLNLENVLFTSGTSEKSAKQSVTPGPTLTATEPVSGTIKLTVKDTSLTLSATVKSTAGRTVTVGYSNATPGTTLSALVTNNSTGEVTYYGKLANVTAATGEAALTVPDGFNPQTESIQVFVEELYSEKYTDFASSPITLYVGVASAPTGLYTTVASSPTAADGTITGTTTNMEYRLASSSTWLPATNTSTNGLIAGTYEVRIKASGTILASDAVTVMVGFGSTPAPSPSHVIGFFEDSSTFIRGTNIELVFVTEKNFILYEHIQVDGQRPTYDQVPVVAGSTRAVLRASYLNTLGIGAHTIELFFTDGTSCSGTFWVKEAVGLAKTSDASPIAPLAVLVLGSLGALVASRSQASNKSMRAKRNR